MKQKTTIKEQMPYFLGKVKGDSSYSILLMEMATTINNDESAEIIQKIPERFKALTGNEISRYSEMEILEYIIKDTLETSDTRFGQLQYYARKRLLDLHFNPITHDTNPNPGLRETSSDIKDEEKEILRKPGPEDISEEIPEQ